MNSIIQIVVEKCMGHAKPLIKNKAGECLLLLFEVSEEFSESTDTINGLLKNKNVKI